MTLYSAAAATANNRDCSIALCGWSPPLFYVWLHHFFIPTLSIPVCRPPSLSHFSSNELFVLWLRQGPSFKAADSLLPVDTSHSCLTRLLGSLFSLIWLSRTTSRPPDDLGHTLCSGQLCFYSGSFGLFAFLHPPPSLPSPFNLLIYHPHLFASVSWSSVPDSDLHPPSTLALDQHHPSHPHSTASCLSSSRLVVPRVSSQLKPVRLLVWMSLTRYCILYKYLSKSSHHSTFSRQPLVCLSQPVLTLQVPTRIPFRPGPPLSCLLEHRSIFLF